MSHMCVNRQRSSCKTNGATRVELVVAISLIFISTSTILLPISSAMGRWDGSRNTIESMLSGHLLVDHVTENPSQATAWQVGAVS
jgi:hypothetical protein